MTDTNVGSNTKRSIQRGTPPFVRELEEMVVVVVSAFDDDDDDEATPWFDINSVLFVS